MAVTEVLKPRGCRGTTVVASVAFADVPGQPPLSRSVTLLAHALQTRLFLLSARETMRKGNFFPTLPPPKWTRTLCVQDPSLQEHPKSRRANTRSPRLALDLLSSCCSPAEDKSPSYPSFYSCSCPGKSVGVSFPCGARSGGASAVCGSPSPSLSLSPPVTK